MTALFFVFVGFVLYHFVWEGILAPSVRLEIRYELFKLRDELRRLKITRGAEIDDELFDWLQHGVNKGIRLLHAANIGNIYQAYREFDHAEMDKLNKLIADCPVEEVRGIFEKTTIYFGLAFFVNSGGWFASVIPILFALLGFTTIKAAIKGVFSMSDNDFNKIFPPRQLPT